MNTMLPKNTSTLNNVLFAVIGGVLILVGLLFFFGYGVGNVDAQTGGSQPPVEVCPECGGGGGSSCTPPKVAEWGAPYTSSCEACKNFCDELNDPELRINCILGCDGQTACTDPHQIPTLYCKEPEDDGNVCTDPKATNYGGSLPCEYGGCPDNPPRGSDCFCQKFPNSPSCDDEEDPPPGTATLVVNKQGTGTGTVTSDPSGISCGSDCRESATVGSAKLWTLTASKGANSTFDGWSEPATTYNVCWGHHWWGGCKGYNTYPTCGTNTSCRVTVQRDSTKTVRATFTSTVPVNTPPRLTVTGPSAGEVDESLPFSFRATDSDGDQVRYQISWDNNTSVEEVLPPSREQCWFAGICFNVPQYVSSGTARSSSYSWSSAGTKRFRARAQDNQGAYSPWVIKTVTIGESEPEPEPVTYRLSVLTLPSGSGSATGADMYNEGTLVTSIATANPGFTFLSWSQCDSVTGTTCRVTMNSNRTITAQFEQTLKPVTITPTDQWVPHGGSTAIEWEGGSSDATCELFEDGSRIERGLSTPSSITVGPITEVTDYRLECTDGVNDVEDTVRIYVLPKYGEF